VIAAQKTIIAAEDDDEICIVFRGESHPQKQNGGIPSTRNAAVGKMQI